MTKKQIEQMRAHLLAGFRDPNNGKEQKQLNKFVKTYEELESNIFANLSLGHSHPDYEALNRTIQDNYRLICRASEMMSADSVKLLEGAEQILSQYQDVQELLTKPVKYLNYSQSLELKQHCIIANLSMSADFLVSIYGGIHNIDLLNKASQVLSLHHIFSTLLICGILHVTPFAYERKPLVHPLNLEQLAKQGLYTESKLEILDVIEPLFESRYDMFISSHFHYKKDFALSLRQQKNSKHLSKQCFTELNKVFQVQAKSYELLKTFLSLVMRSIVNDPWDQSASVLTINTFNYIGYAEVIVQETISATRLASEFCQKYASLLTLGPFYKRTLEKQQQELDEQLTTIAQMMVLLKEQVQCNPDLPQDGQF